MSAMSFLGAGLGGRTALVLSLGLGVVVGTAAQRRRDDRPQPPAGGPAEGIKVHGHWTIGPEPPFPTA